MKRAELLKHLGRQGCVLYREGKRHTLYVNPRNGRISAIPRHREVNDYLIVRICSVDLDVPLPQKRG